MIIETETIEDGRTAYKFIDRQTKYLVVSPTSYDPTRYTIISERMNVSFGPQLKMMSLEEMAKRSKTFANLVTLLAA